MSAAKTSDFSIATKFIIKLLASKLFLCLKPEIGITQSIIGTNNRKINNINKCFYLTTQS
jgi:hypothetical protein